MVRERFASTGGGTDSDTDDDTATEDTTDDETTTERRRRETVTGDATDTATQDAADTTAADTDGTTDADTTDTTATTSDGTPETTTTTTSSITGSLRDTLAAFAPTGGGGTTTDTEPMPTDADADTSEQRRRETVTDPGATDADTPTGDTETDATATDGMDTEPETTTEPADEPMDTTPAEQQPPDDGLTDAQEQDIAAAFAEDSERVREAQQGVEAGGAPPEVVSTALELEQQVLAQNEELDATDVRITRDGDTLEAEFTQAGAEAAGLNRSVADVREQVAADTEFREEELQVERTDDGFRVGVEQVFTDEEAADFNRRLAGRREAIAENASRVASDVEAAARNTRLQTRRATAFENLNVDEQISIAFDEAVGRANTRRSTQRGNIPTDAATELEQSLEEETGAELDREDITVERVESDDGVRFEGGLSERGQQEVAGQRAPGSDLPVVGGPTAGIAESIVAADQAVEVPDLPQEAETLVPRDLTGASLGAAAGAAVVAPEPVTSASGALVLGGLATVGVGAEVAQRTGTFQGPPTARARVRGSELPVTDEGLPESELPVTDPTAFDDGELPVADPTVREEVKTPTGDVFDSELPVTDPDAFQQRELPVTDAGDADTATDATRDDSVVPGDFPLPGRDLPADPARDFIGSDPDAVFGTLELAKQIGRQRGRERARDQPTIGGEYIPADPFADEIDQPGPSTRERQQRDELVPFERTFPTGEQTVIGREVESPTEGEELLREAEQTFPTDTDTPLPGEEAIAGVFDRQEQATAQQVATRQDDLADVALTPRVATRPRLDTAADIDTAVDTQLRQQQELAQRQALAQQQVTQPRQATATAPGFGTPPETVFETRFGEGVGTPTTTTPATSRDIRLPDPPEPDDRDRDRDPLDLEAGLFENIVVPPQEAIEFDPIDEA